MTNQKDVIVLDLEKYPQIDVWGEKLGGNLGLEYFYLDDEYFDYIPQHIKYLRLSSKEATLGSKYWAEIRATKSSYGESDAGTTLKEKEPVDSDIISTYAVPFMKNVLTLKVQEIFEKRYNLLRTKYSTLEDATWQDQLSESNAYLEDETIATNLIHRLAELRGLTTKQFASKVVEKQKEWKEKLFDLAIQEQSLILKIKDCVNMREVNLFLEDYFGIQMPLQQCLEYNRCIKDDESGLVSRKEPFVYGIKF